MRITKLLLTSLLLCSFMIPAITAQQQNSRGDRSKARNRSQSSSNRPPVIKSLTTSSSSMIIPCPRWTARGWIIESIVFKLTTDASDPDGDTLSYQYLVTDGQITDEGPNVSWDLTNMAPGFYEVKVIVSDQRGGITSSSLSVTLFQPICCLPPCGTIYVDCPSEVEEGQSVTLVANISGGEPNIVPTGIGA